MPKVVIAMPAYHAERTLEQTVRAIPPGVADELILVDDASLDGTASLARTLGLTVHVHTSNRGYGGNQKSCYLLALEADADIVVLLHPDYQYEPRAVPLLIAPILAGDADMTFGSRFAGMGDPLGGGMPFYRYVGNRLTTVAQNVCLGTRFTDMHSGMRAFTRRALQSLPFLGYPDGFSFDAELLVDAVTSGLRVVEVPIPTRYTLESSSISISRSLGYVFHGTAYAARRGVERGRRGRRYLPGWRRSRPPKACGPLSTWRCVACGNDQMALKYPATVKGDVPPESFHCTAPAVGLHDDILECGRCGLVSSRPTLSPEEILEGYEGVVDEDYLSEEAARRQLFRWMSERIGDFPVRGNRLFEIGAHVGLFLSVAAERGWDAAGIEPSAWAVDLGRERFDVDLRRGTVEMLDLEPSSIDVIAMFDVLEHLSDPMRALRHLRPFVNRRGLLALSTVNVESLHGQARGERWTWFTRTHLHHFRPPTLIRMLTNAGFETVQWTVVPRSFHLSYLLRRAPHTLPGTDGLLRLTDVADPRVPLGWLGDVTLVIARPMPS